MSEFEDVKKDVAVLKSEVKQWMDTTTEYRKSLCYKIDLISNKLSNLNCAVHQERMGGLQNNLKALWVVTGGMVIAIIAEWIKGK